MTNGERWGNDGARALGLDPAAEWLDTDAVLKLAIEMVTDAVKSLAKEAGTPHGVAAKACARAAFTLTMEDHLLNGTATEPPTGLLK